MTQQKPTYEQLEQRLKDLEADAARKQTGRNKSLGKEEDQWATDTAYVLKCLETVSQSIENAKDVEQAIEDVLEVVFSMFNCDRIWLFYPCDPKAQTFRVFAEKSKPEYPGAFISGQELPITEEVAANIRKALDLGKPAVFGPESEEKVNDVAAQFSVLSQMIMAVHPRSEKPWMFGMHQCSHVRKWSTIEQGLFQEISVRVVRSLNHLILLRDLRNSEQKYRHLLENLPQKIFHKDIDSKYQSCNENFARDLNIQPPEIEGTTDYDHFPKDLAEKYIQDDQRIMASGITQEIIEKYRSGNEDFWVQTVKTPLKDENGNPAGILGIFWDVTDRKRAEDELQESETRYKELLSGMKSGVVVYRAANDGEMFIITDCNKASEQIENLRKEDIIGKSVVDVFPGVKDFGIFDVFQRVWRSGNPEHHPVTLYRDSRIFGWRDNYVYRLPTGDIVAVYDDVTDIRQAEMQRQLGEEKYRELAQSANSIILKFDQNYNFTFLNKFALDYFGFSEDELLGRSPIGTIIPETESTGRNLKKKMEQIFSNPEIFADNENENITKSGKRVWVAWRNKGMYNDQGNLVGLLCMGYDITERRHAEELLQKSLDEMEKQVEARTHELQIAMEEAEQANQAKSEFLANISHELRNPMHQILSYSKYGLDKIHKPKEKLAHYFRQTRKSAERLMVLLNDLLDLSKMESGKMDYTLDYNNVHKIVEEAILELQPAIRNKKLTISSVDHPSVSTSTICDYYKIGQVVRNLITNAIKFSPEAKNIDITYEKDELQNSDNPIPALKVSIYDQGVGIPENELNLVFDKFTQSSKTKTGAGGTGLGLAICQEIILAHHGKIWAENNPDGGSTFCFVLPYEQPII